MISRASDVTLIYDSREGEGMRSGGKSRFLAQLELLYAKDRIRKVEELYDGMVNWYADFLKTENARECIAKFDEVLPDYAWLSDVKKIDFFLWSIR